MASKGMRRSDIIEAERNYKLVKKEKKESGKVIKQTLRFLFSQVGLIALGMAVAILGKFMHYLDDAITI